MPWFPEFTSAVELVRLQTREAGHADPVGHYVAALNKKDATDLETAWPGQVVIYDPRAGEVRGHRQVRHFVRQNELWLAGMNPRTETVASTMADGKTVVELVVHLTQDGRDVSWPLAVVAESHDDRSVVFRTYCSQWPLIGRHEVRPPILPAGPAGRPAALSASSRTRSRPATPTRWCGRSSRTGTSASRSARSTRTAVPVSCTPTSPSASARGAAWACSSAW